ncbi:MAG: hypothetical protein CMN15_07485 [Roseovarius sp.]|jgi:signal transduction histidine kinase|nr:hypothetical protein [Roseovarius sp.]
MSCLTNFDVSTVSLSVLALWAVSGLVLIWVARSHRFAGKPAFILTFAAMLWWLFTVAADFASVGLDCKVAWSLAAWPGIALLPIAWAFFLFDYTLNPDRHSKRRRPYTYIGVPLVVSLVALTNGQTHMLYTEATYLVEDAPHPYVVFDHGPLFYAVAAGLYVFVLSSLGVLLYAFHRATVAIRPFLGVLLVITAAPLSANFAYIVWGFTVFGFDPTPFMFTAALLAFSWLLTNNTMMDTEAQGRSLIFYATSDPVLITDSEFRFTGANPAATEIFGPLLPKPGGSLRSLLALAPILNTLDRDQSTARGAPVPLADRIFEPRILPIESPIRTRRNLLGWTISLVDITEREHSAQALREALVRAEAANHAKSQFIAMISHELRTPMTSVKGGLDLALNGFPGEPSEPIRKLLNIAQRNSMRMLKLIDDVLDLQKLDLNTLRLHPVALDMDELLANLLEEHAGQADQAKVRLTIVSDKIGQQVHVDPNRVRQVVGNVISNAIKFSPEGAHVDLSVQLKPEALRLSVRDSGIGIPAKSEDRVFGRFHQIESDLTPTHGGSGLGMHIAKVLIERMGGAISYESVLGQGTVFHIDLPLAA